MRQPPGRGQGGGGATSFTEMAETAQRHRTARTRAALIIDTKSGLDIEIDFVVIWKKKSDDLKTFVVFCCVLCCVALGAFGEEKGGACGRSGLQREGDLSRGGPVVDLFGAREVVVLEIRGPADERI